MSSGSPAPDSQSSNSGAMTQEQEADAIAALNVQAGVHRQGFTNKVCLLAVACEPIHNVGSVNSIYNLDNSEVVLLCIHCSYIEVAVYSLI